MKFHVVFLGGAALLVSAMGAAVPAADSAADSAPVEGNEVEFSNATVEPQDLFAASCQSYGMNPTYHTQWDAQCRNSAGALVGTFIDLGLCLGNFNGRMNFAMRGNYAASCDISSCGSSGQDYHCNCRDENGNYQASSINLNALLGNDNGRLVCFGLYGNG